MADDPEGRGGGSGTPAAGTRGRVPAAVVLTATARASNAYTASAAQSAATALVQMFIDQGVFGPGPWEEPATAPAPAEPVGLHARPDALEHIPAAVDLAEARRKAGPGPGCPAVTGVRLMGEIIGRVAQGQEDRSPDGHRAAAPARAV